MIVYRITKLYAAIFVQLVGIKYKNKSRLLGIMYLNTSQKEKRQTRKKGDDVNSEENSVHGSTQRRDRCKEISRNEPRTKKYYE